MLDPFVPSPRTRRELGKRVDGLRPKEDANTPGYSPPSGDDDTALHDAAVAADGDQPSSGIVEAGPRQGRAEPWAEGGAVDSLPPELPKRRSPVAGVVVALLLVAGLVAGWVGLRANDVGKVSSGEQTPAAANEVAKAEPVEQPRQEPPLQDEPAAPPDPIEPSAEPAQAEEPSTTAADEPGGTPATDAARPPKGRRPPHPAALVPASLTVVVYPWGDVWIDGELRGSAPLRNLAVKPGRYTIGAGQGEPTITRTIRLRPGEKKKLKLDVTR